MALNVAAFYILPIPALQLADYLENIFQISLVILAALISYEILIQEDSEDKRFSRISTQFLTPFLALKVGTQLKQGSNNLEARICGKLVWGKVKLSYPKLDRRYIIVKLRMLN